MYIVYTKENLFAQNEISFSHNEKWLWENENVELEIQLIHHYIKSFYFFESEFLGSNIVFLHENEFYVLNYFIIYQTQIAW